MDVLQKACHKDSVLNGDNSEGDGRGGNKNDLEVFQYETGRGGYPLLLAALLLHFVL